MMLIQSPATLPASVVRWFRAQGLAPPARPPMPRNASLPLLKLHPGPAQQQQQRTADVACATPRAGTEPSNAELLRLSTANGCMLVFDFDRTLVDWDAGAPHTAGTRSPELVLQTPELPCEVSLIKLEETERPACLATPRILSSPTSCGSAGR